MEAIHERPALADHFCAGDEALVSSGRFPAPNPARGRMGPRCQYSEPACAILGTKHPRAVLPLEGSAPLSSIAREYHGALAWDHGRQSAFIAMGCAVFL